MIRYIITGAAGHLGSTIVMSLVKENRAVRGLILPLEKPVVSGTEYITGNVLDVESLQALFQREKEERLVVIHTAGVVDVTGNMSRQLYEVNVTGTQNILKCCRKYKVDKLVYVSSVHAIPETNSTTFQTESRIFAPELVTGGYAKTKAQATQDVLDAATHGLPAVVIHPSGIIGPYDNGRNHLVQMVLDFMEGRLPACVKGGYDFVDVRDVAEGCLLAADCGEPGECYILSGAYHEVKELLDMVAPLCGKRCPVVLPMPLARATEPILRFYAERQGRRPLYTKYSLDTLCSPARFSAQKAKNELGYTARDIQTTMQDTVAWLKTERAETLVCS